MMSAGRSLPSSAPVMARISKRAATEVAAVAEVELDRQIRRRRRVDRLVERDGDVRRAVVRGVGRPAVFVAGVEDAFGAVVGEPGVGGDLRDVEQAVEIHLVAGDGFGAGGEGGEDERAFDRRSAAWSLSLERLGRVGGDGAVAAAAAGVLGIGMEDDADAGDRLVEFRQPHRDVVGDERRRATVMWTKSRRVDVEAVAGVRRADFQQLDGVEFEVLAAGAKPQALLVFPTLDVGVGRVARVFL